MSDPKRLRDGEADELRDLLRAAEDDVLDDGATDRVRAGLVSALPAGVFGGATLWSRLRAGLASNPWAAALVAGGAAVGAYAFLSSGTPAPQTPTTPVSSAHASASAAPSVAEVAPPPASQEPLRAAASASIAPRATASTAPRVPPREERQDAGAPSPREGLLLLQARQALERDPARALDLVRQHEREFPNSQLAPERDKLRRDAEARAAE